MGFTLMGRENGHTIGEPVPLSRMGTGEKPLATFLSGDTTGRMMKIVAKRSIIIFGIMILMVVLITLPFMLITGPFLMIIMLFVFGLIFPLSFILAMALVYHMRSKSGRNKIELYRGHVLIIARYSDYFPVNTVKIPYHHIGSIKINGEKIWKELLKDTPGHYRFLNRKPYPPDEGLFSFISDKEDLITLHLKEPVKFEKMMPPKGFIDRARTKKFRVEKVIIDIDRTSHGEFLRKLGEMGVSTW